MSAGSDDGSPPAKNTLAERLLSVMISECMKDIAEIERQQDRFISILQQIIRAKKSQYEVPPPISDDGERFNNQTTSPDDSEDGDKENGGPSASGLQSIKVEPAYEAETPHLSDSISQRVKALAAKKLHFATSSDSESTRSEKKRRAPDTPHPLAKMAKLSESDGTPISQDKAGQLDVKVEPIDEDEPYMGDPEVERAVFAESESASSYGARLGNFIFEGEPHVSYSMLPRSKREWLNSMVEQRFPCPKGADQHKYNDWRQNIQKRRKRTFDRMEKLKDKINTLLAEGEATSNTGEPLDEEVLSRSLEHEAFLNNPDEIHYAGRLATLLWPNTDVPPFRSGNGLRVEDNLRINYLIRALDERYPVLKANSVTRAENILSKLRKKTSM